VHRIKGNKFILFYFHFYFFKDTKNVTKQCVITAEGENVLPHPLQMTVAPQLVFDTLYTKNLFWRKQKIFM